MALIKNSEIKNIRLERSVANLGTKAIKIKICEGAGWITHNKHDIFIHLGQKITLEATRHPILISPLRQNQQIIFKVEQIH